MRCSFSSSASHGESTPSVEPAVVAPEQVVDLADRLLREARLARDPQAEGPHPHAHRQAEQVELRQDLVDLEPRVTRHRLVGTFTRQRDLVAARPHCFGENHQGGARRIDDRHFRRRDEFRVGRPHVGVAVLDHERLRADVPRGLRRLEFLDDGGIDPARKVGHDRNVGAQSAVHGGDEELLELIDGLRTGRVEFLSVIGKVDLPVNLSLDRRVTALRAQVDLQVLTRQQEVDPLEASHRPWHGEEAEDLVEAARVGLRLDVAGSQ
jgi:hypothetical protein